MIDPLMDPLKVAKKKEPLSLHDRSLKGSLKGSLQQEPSSRYSRCLKGSLKGTLKRNPNPYMIDPLKT